MTDYAIHSPNDGELLIKFHDELVKKGFFTDAEWNKDNNPNTGWFTLCIPHDIDTSIFYSMSGDAYKIHHTLTPKNFNSVLNEVLQNFDIEYKD